MTNLKTLLSTYSGLADILEATKKRYGINDMEKIIDEVFNKIKDVARSVKDGEIELAKTKTHQVVVSHPYKTSYDLKAIKKFATEDEYKLVESILTIEVNKGKFEELVNSGLVSRELKRKAFREEAQTPRVSIRKIQ